MTVTPLYPDLGKLTAEPSGNGDEMLLNAAMVVALAKKNGGPKCKAFLRGFNASWRATAGQPLTTNARERAAMEAGMAAVGARVVDGTPS